MSERNDFDREVDKASKVLLAVLLAVVLIVVGGFFIFHEFADKDRPSPQDPQPAAPINAQLSSGSAKLSADRLS